MIFFVIPAYNESENIQTLLTETHNFCSENNLTYKLIIVDDGSSDNTAEIVQANAPLIHCQLISYRPNRGVGNAFRVGLDEALAQAGAADVIVTKEADNTSDLNILKQMLSKIEAGCDVALASCYAPGGGIEGTSLYRMLLSRCANILIYSAFHIKGVHTYSSFYRAYKPSVLASVKQNYGEFYAEKGFACVIELLVRIAKLGAKIEEVPMTLKSSKRIGSSKMNVRKTIMGYMRVIKRNAFDKAKR